MTTNTMTKPTSRGMPARKGKWARTGVTDKTPIAARSVTNRDLWRAGAYQRPRTNRGTELAGRVCTTYPRCSCGATDEFTCNCLAGSGHGRTVNGLTVPTCAKCRAALVTVEDYEQIMVGRNDRASRKRSPAPPAPKPPEATEAKHARRSIVEHDAKHSRRFVCSCGEHHVWPIASKPGKALRADERDIECRCGALHCR